MDRAFGWLWAAFAVSTLGTWLAFDAFPLIAVLSLHAGPVAVSALAAAGLAVAALVAVPLGAFVERRRKRPVMIATDVVRCVALLCVPAAFALGQLSFGLLLVVAVVVGAADIAFRAASGAYLKWLLPPAALPVATGRFEATTWTATTVGPPLGGAAIGVLGPVVTVLANAVSFVVSAVGLGAIRRPEPAPAAAGSAADRDVLAGWRHVLAHTVLRPLLANTVAVNALVLAPAPLMAVLMVGRLGFAPWAYALAFGAPCVGGIAGARWSRRLVAAFGLRRVLRVAGTLRACWPLGLALVVPGPAGLVLVLVLQLGLVTSVGVFNPVFAAYRLQQTGADRVARTLAAWTVTNNAVVAVVTLSWGLLAQLVGLRGAVAAAGALLLLTPLLLPRDV